MPQDRPRLLLHVYATFAVGGPQVRFAAIANHFGRRYRHAIIAMDGNTACRERLSPDLDVIFPEIEIRKGDTLGNIMRFRTLLAEMRPDTLITSNWGSIEWAMANFFSLVRHVHVEDGFGPEERATQLRRRVWTRRIMLRRCIVALPSRVLWRIARDVWKLNPARIRYIPNGVDLAAFRPHADRAVQAIPVIGTVAALRVEKNLARLIRAVRLVADRMPVQAVIVGDGPERTRLQALAAELDLGEVIRFTGHVVQPKAVYSHFDIFALSSDTEQMPLSVLEAMAAGLPIAATDVGDVREMLGPENGDRVVPCDDASLANALSQLLADPVLCARLGAANRVRAEQSFSQADMFTAYAALFDGDS